MDITSRNIALASAGAGGGSGPWINVWSRPNSNKWGRYVNHSQIIGDGNKIYYGWTVPAVSGSSNLELTHIHRFNPDGSEDWRQYIKTNDNAGYGTADYCGLRGLDLSDNKQWLLGTFKVSHTSQNRYQACKINPNTGEFELNTDALFSKDPTTARNGACFLPNSISKVAFTYESYYGKVGSLDLSDLNLSEWSYWTANGYKDNNLDWIGSTNYHPYSNTCHRVPGDPNIWTTQQPKSGSGKFYPAVAITPTSDVGTYYLKGWTTNNAQTYNYWITVENNGDSYVAHEVGDNRNANFFKVNHNGSYGFSVAWKRRLQSNSGNNENPSGNRINYCSVTNTVWVTTVCGDKNWNIYQLNASDGTLITQRTFRFYQTPQNSPPDYTSTTPASLASPSQRYSEAKNPFDDEGNFYAPVSTTANSPTNYPTMHALVKFPPYLADLPEQWVPYIDLNADSDPGNPYGYWLWIGDPQTLLDEGVSSAYSPSNMRWNASSDPSQISSLGAGTQVRYNPEETFEAGTMDRVGYDYPAFYDAYTPQEYGNPVEIST